MSIVRQRRPAVLFDARNVLACALGLLSIAGCDLDRSSVGSPSSTIDDPARSSDGGVVESDGGLVSLDSGVLPIPDPTLDAGPTVVVPPNPGCDLTGSFSVQIEAQVQWNGTTLFGIVPIISQGNGKLSVAVRVDLTEQGGVRMSSVRACGATTPDFSSIVDETYGVAFPDEVWEKLVLRWMTGVATSCSEPGCSFDSGRVLAQMGLGIPDTAVWPTSRDPIDVSTLRDDDADGAPGVLLRCRGPKDSGNYTHPPASALLSPRVSEIMMAIRLGAQLTGTLDSCDQISGSVPGMTIDTRALGCQLESGGRCSPDQLGFIDDNLPVWRVNSAKFKAVRVAPAASCAEVRAQKP